MFLDLDHPPNRIFSLLFILSDMTVAQIRSYFVDEIVTKDGQFEYSSTPNCMDAVNMRPSDDERQGINHMASVIPIPFLGFLSLEALN